MTAAECAAIIKIVEFARDIGMYVWKDHANYIRRWEKNLDSLHQNLSAVCDKKDDINEKVKEGEDNHEQITSEAASWLKDVRKLSKNVKLNDLMFKNMETARFVVKLMEKRDLKRRLSQEREMQAVVVKVMKKLKDEMEDSDDEMRKMVEAYYNEVAQDMVEVIMDTVEELKRLLKEDMKMAIMAKNTLQQSDLEMLTASDQEMKEIIWEAQIASNEEVKPNDEDEETSASSGAAIRLLITPIWNWPSHFRELIDDEAFRNTVPKHELVKLWLVVIDCLCIKILRLKKETDDNTDEQQGCYYHYKISKAAEKMANLIRDDIINKYPTETVTFRQRVAEGEPIPTQFMEGLESRAELLHQILDRLKDDQVKAVGLFGMGGIGKTILAKEINNRARDLFDLKVMVEVTHDPNIVSIQTAIAESIKLHLQGIENVTRRANILLNRLKKNKKEGLKILLILDDVWKKVDFDEIGIPHGVCKLLLITREKDVFRLMNIKDVNMFKVGLINSNEARDLLMSQTGDEVYTDEYENVVKKLLSTCGGLPLAIVRRAESLKNKDLEDWKYLTRKWEKPISSQNPIDYQYMNSILKTSYDFIVDDNQRIFFLLACLYPLNSRISIESLTKYGIGLNLFPRVDKLCEALEVADNWATKLVSSSMLIDGDAKGDVKVHTIMRAFAILYAAKEEKHNFLVDAITGWMKDDAFNEYTAISLISKKDYDRLIGVEVSKLQILKLRGDLSASFDDSFFEKMGNLEVLDLSNMNFQPCLPKSMQKLKKLKTLCMEDCKLGDIKKIGELNNLLVLSLRDSFLEELPNEIGDLCKLQLLDLSGCKSNMKPLIPDGVLCRLSQLEGLYCLINNNRVGFEWTSDGEGTSVTEHNSLPNLNALEIKIAETEELPIDDQFVQNLDTFKVCVGDKLIKEFTVCVGESVKANQSLRLLDFNGIGHIGRVLEKSCFKTLLKKANCLGITSSKGFEHLVPQLEQEGFINLSSLYVYDCNDVKCIIKERGMEVSRPFSCLQSLDLRLLPKLKMLCDEKASPGAFSKLQTLNLRFLEELEYALPRALLPPNLNHIFVDSCKSLNFVFVQNEETHATILLPFLKSLKLINVPNLLSLSGPKNSSNTHDALQGPQVLFHGKIVFPSLELFELVDCSNVATLWSKEINACDFQNLKDILIEGCEKLLSVGSPSVFAVLSKLECLRIKRCEMLAVVAVDNSEGSERGEQNIRFPLLKCLELGSLKKLRSFNEAGSKLVAPKLEDVTMSDCQNMQQFLKGNPSQNMELPSLQKVHIHRCPKFKSLSPGFLKAPKLREVQLSYCCNMGSISPTTQNNNGDLILPLLEGVDISLYLNIQSLLPKRLFAPKLTHILHGGGKKYSVLKIDFLNESLQNSNVINN